MDVGRSLLTHVSDPDGHPLVEEVQDHDDDKVDAGGGGRGRQLRRDEPAHHLDLPHGVFNDTGEGGVHGKSVRYHPDDTGHDQSDL